MATLLRSTVRSAIAAGANLVKWTWVEFAKMAMAQGFVEYVELLDRNPADGKFPFIAFSNPVNNESITVMLSKGVSAVIRDGKLPFGALKALSIIDGKNQAGEPRYYLSSNGVTPISVEEAIKHAEAYKAEQVKLSKERLEKMIAGA